VTSDQAVHKERLGLFALVGGQRIDHAVDGFDCVRRVQRAGHQVAGFCSGHRPADRVRIT
jgi:hypothetical protein